jgi:hypothetical protein
MPSVRVGVESRRSGVEGEVSQSPRFNAPLIDLRSLGFVGHCGHGERWFPYPDLPPFIVALRERGPLPYTTGAPDQDADRIGFPIRRSHS